MMNFRISDRATDVDQYAKLILPARSRKSESHHASRHVSLESPVPLITIDEILYSRPQLPLTTSRDRGWGGVTLDLHRPYFGCAESYPGLDHHLICYCPSGTARLTQIRAGSIHRGVISGGTSFLMPAGYLSSWEGESGLSARLRMPISLVSKAADECDWERPTSVEIQNVFETRDETIGHLALTLMGEVKQTRHPAQKMIVDALSAALAVHLLRRYNVFEAAERDNELRLSRYDLGRLTEYIEDNLDRSIGLSELAGIVNISRFHFVRLFKRSTGNTPMDFVEQSRINRARSLIADTDLPLAEIALITGFADQSHFTRRFRSRVGCTPGAYLREYGRRRSPRRIVD